MNKITRKFLGVVLSLGLLSTISFATQAKTKVASYIAYFNYKDKDMNEIGFGKEVKNKTSAKEYLHFYTILQMLFKKYNIPEKHLSKGLDIFGSYNNKNLKLKGDFRIVAEDLKQEKNFENLIKNFNRELKNIKITKEDFENAKYNLINDIKNEIERLRNILNNALKNKNFQQFKNYKNYEYTDEGLIKFARDMTKQTIKDLEEKLKKTSNKQEIKNIKEQIANQTKFLKDDDAALKKGKLSYTMGESTCESVSNNQKHLQEVENIKYEDYEDIDYLTKSLTIKDKYSKNYLSKKEAY